MEIRLQQPGPTLLHPFTYGEGATDCCRPRKLFAYECAAVGEQPPRPRAPPRPLVLVKMLNLMLCAMLTDAPLADG